MKSVNEVLKQIKKEFKDSKENSVIIDNFITKYFGYPEASELTKVRIRAIEVISSLCNTRGVYEVDTSDATVVVNGNFCNMPTCIRLIRKPCKEFLQLNNYLTKYATSHLTTTEVATQQVSGKRNNFDVNSEVLLAHNSEKCANTLAWLREKKATTFNIEVRVDKYVDRSSGYEEEREWTGTHSFALSIKLTSKKTGKLKDQLRVFA